MSGIQQQLLGGPFGAGAVGDPNWQNVTLLSGTTNTNAGQNNTFLDSSSNNFTITRNGNTTQGTFTPFSQAAGYWSNYFGGSSFISTPYSSTFAMNTYATFECWVNFSALSSDRLIFGKDGFWLGYSYTGIGISANKFGFAIYNGGSWTAVSSATTPVVGQWNHVVGVRDNTTLRIYINGIQEATTSFGSSPIVSSFDLCVGANTGTQSPITGYVSNARYCNGATSGALPYTGNFTPPTTPLTATASTVFLTCQSNRFIDNSTANSGSGFPITATGSPSVVPFQPFGAPTSPYSTTNVGGSGYFDGTGDYLNIARNSAFDVGSGDFTIECWVYAGAFVTATPLFCQQQSSGSARNSWSLRTDSSGYPQFQASAGSDNDVLITSSTPITLNSWNHLAGVRNGNNWTLYVNGVSTGTATASITVYYDPTYGDVVFGASRNVATYDRYYTGYISNARLVKGTAVYTAAFTPPTTPLTAITNTQLLCNFTNAGIFDNAAKNDMETVGNAQVSTSVVKYGTGSMAFDGTGDYLVMKDTPQMVFGTGDFTIEFWLRLISAPSSGSFVTLYDSRPTSGSGNYPTIYLNGSNATLIYYTNNANRITGSNLSTGQWYHIAVSRSGTSTKLFIDGTQSGSTYTDSLDYINGSFRPAIGVNGFDLSSGYLNGYIDNLRVTKGVGRYTYNFTPPTRAFSNFYQAAATPTADPYFNYTTMLLPGSGTNGAQNNTFLDSSTNAFSITRNGNTTQGTFSPFSVSASEWSNHFDGSGDYLTVANNTALKMGTGDFRVEAWIYPTTAAYQTVVCMGRYQSNAGVLRVQDDNKVRWYFNDNSVGVTTSNTVTLNAWNHICASRVSNTTKVFINGTEGGSFSDTSNYDSTYQTVIGGEDQSGSFVNTVYGYLSNVRIVKGSGVTSVTVPTTPLTAISGTSLLTCQSNRFVDNSSNAFTITRNGDTRVQAFSPFAPTAAYSAGTNGGSGYFDGTGDYLQTSTSQVIPTGSFTIEAWVYTTQAISTTKNIVAQGSSGDSGRTALSIEGSAWWFQIGSNYVNAGTPVLGQWNYVAMTYNGSTIQGYVNGVSQGTVSNTNNAQNTTLAIGTDWNNAVWNGYIASVRISNTVRTVTTVPTTPFTNDANTRFLCNFTNAGITDAAAKNDLETVGNAQISTTQSKFGGGSMYFDGTGDYLTVPSSPNLAFGSGDYTIEFWIYFSSIASNNTVFDGRTAAASTAQVPCIIYYSGLGWYYFVNGSTLVSGGSASTSTWTHVAVCRSGTSTKMFINGSQIGSTATDNNVYISSVLTIGARYDNTENLNGFIDDLRITKGIARYTQNFTPPTAAFQLL